jgi:DNA-binding transcriptional LysR family regulator
MMDERQLRFFLSICKEKSFSKAAGQLFISQQGLSKVIKQLEEHLDAPLFYRTPHGLELTEFGVILQKAAKSYINQHDNIIDTIRQHKGKTKFRVSVGITIGFNDSFPSNFFKNFILEHPDIDLNIMSFTDDACQDSMLEYNVHVGFSSAPVDTNCFDSIYNIRNKIRLMVGKNHRLAQCSSIKLKDIRDETIITLNSNMYPQVLITDLCVRNGFKPKTFLHSSENSLIYELCSTNRIVSFWADAIDKYPDVVCVDIEDMDLYWECHLIVNKHSYISDAAGKFIAYAKQRLSESER